MLRAARTVVGEDPRHPRPDLDASCPVGLRRPHEASVLQCAADDDRPVLEGDVTPLEGEGLPDPEAAREQQPCQATGRGRGRIRGDEAVLHRVREHEAQGDDRIVDRLRSERVRGGEIGHQLAEVTGRYRGQAAVSERRDRIAREGLGAAGAELSAVDRRERRGQRPLSRREPPTAFLTWVPSATGSRWRPTSGPRGTPVGRPPPRLAPRRGEGG
jgi:hypothetical protein